MTIDLNRNSIVYVEPPGIPDIRAAPISTQLPVLVVAGPPGPPGPEATGAGRVTATLVAAEALSGHRAVTLGSDDRLIYASSDRAEHLHAPVMVTTGAAEAGAPVEVVVYGVLGEPSWSWEPGGVLYLGLNGLITQVAPATPPALFLIIIGTATGETTAFIDRSPSILFT